MDDKTRKAAEKVIADHANLSRELQHAVKILSERHSYVARLDAHHMVRNLSGSNSCSKTDLLVLSGSDKTGPSGRVTLPIQSLMCEAVAREGFEDERIEFVIVREPNFVATAHGSTPKFLTSVTHSTPQQVPPTYFLNDRDGNDMAEGGFLDEVTIEVMAWRQNGSAAQLAGFSWICTVEVARKMFIGG